MIFEYLSWMIVYLYYMDAYLEFFFSAYLPPPPSRLESWVRPWATPLTFILKKPEGGACQRGS